MFDDTIVAIATPLSRGAISIIRLSGDNAIQIADEIFSRSLENAESHKVQYGFIQENGTLVDEVLLTVFRAPRSYTREDVVEISSHGGVLITRRILELLLSHGARLANPGEFTQRAFLNGRIDLSQAEAVEEMIDASSNAAANQAIYAIKGSIRQTLEPLIDDLMDIIANIEVNIDYPEYDDVEEMTAIKLLPASQSLLKRIDDLLDRSKRSQRVRQGISTAIVGKPNVGKSSLLNALIEEDKAIVTNIPGTTRDLVEGQIQVGSVLLNLIDTAGIRHSDDVVEQIGIEKSRQKIEEASLILLVLDGSRELDEEDRTLLEMTKDKNRLILMNKSDLKTTLCLEDAIAVSAAEHHIDPLLYRLKEMFPESENVDLNVLNNERQIGLLINARADMMKAIQAMESHIEPDLIEIDLVSAHDHLKEILGEVSRDDLLDTLFSNFCLGK